MDVSDAYRHCEQVVSREARNFFYGMRLLPPPKRRALSAVYAFARRIDDIADGDEPAGRRLARLCEARAALDTVCSGMPEPYGLRERTGTPERAGAPELTGAPERAGVPEPAGAPERTGAPEAAGVPERAGAREPSGTPDGSGEPEPSGVRAAPGWPPPGPEDPVLVALRHAALRHPIPLRAFGELIDGCAADVRGTRYARFEELLAYCRCVAGSIGRLSLGVFGVQGDRDVREAEPLADALGVALQITNILRDVREDRLAGRIYLPAEDLDRFGCTLDVDPSGGLTDPPDRLAALVRFEADRARAWFTEGMRLLPVLDGRSAACTAAMAGIYRCLLGGIAADPAGALATRLSLPPWRKAMVAVGALAGTVR
ncbi:squalene/phytoene synthase family protein [Streptosporangium sandarakinum]|uniref:squalene/phytoene synthase family protein n=1 Tax=Streptosporangium sandarakinum TaxID=1260955 RepID=UPI0034458C8C